MPRDLSMEDRPLQLTASPKQTDHQDAPDNHNSGGQVVLHPNPPKDDPKSLMNLYPSTRLLTISDLESCVALEDAAFENPHERCSREKFIYRLTKCGELSLGLFSTVDPETAQQGELQVATLSAARPVETGRPDVQVLLAHAVATRTTADVVTDEAMDYPRDWDSANPAPNTVGHREDGRTICLHSFAVAPGFHKRGLGRTLLTAYIQQYSTAGIADRIAIIAHDNLVQYYEGFGFVNKGPSKAQFGGGNWVDMVREIKPLEHRTAYG